MAGLQEHGVQQAVAVDAVELVIVPDALHGDFRPDGRVLGPLRQDEFDALTRSKELRVKN